MSAVTHSISEVERQLRVDEERLDSLENLKKVSTVVIQSTSLARFMMNRWSWLSISLQDPNCFGYMLTVGTW